MLEYGTYPKTITVDPGTTVVVTTPWSYIEKDTVAFFSSDPDGANVYIDDSMKGVTPLSLHLKKGTYIVKMTKKDYVDDESALYVGSADPVQVTKTLETPGFGSILALVALVAVVLLARKSRK
jgi:PGF-CTERM protein